MVRPLILGTCLVMSWLAAGCATPHSRTVAANPTPSRDCIRETGTRLTAPEGRCVNIAGRSYTAADLERTGEFDVAAALKRLDTSFQ